jgi:hypothetical protein
VNVKVMGCMEDLDKVGRIILKYNLCKWDERA